MEFQTLSNSMELSFNDDHILLNCRCTLQSSLSKTAKLKPSKKFLLEHQVT